MPYISLRGSGQEHQSTYRQTVFMKYALALVILGVVAAQLVVAQNGDHQPPSGGDHGKPGEAKPKLALQRLRRQIPAGGGQMGGQAGGQAGGGASGQAGGGASGQAGGGASGQAGGGASGQVGGGASGQFGIGGGAGAGGGASAGGSAGLNGGFSVQAQGQVQAADN